MRLTNYAIYGEEATDSEDINLNGQLWQQYDESGKIEMMEFDFKGNLLSKKQLVISSATLKSALDNYTTYLVDWTGLPSILGTQEFETSSEFDALNRATKITLPENVNTDRKEIVPTYNRAGALEKVDYDGTEYVKDIVYNAKGQRLLIAFGNDVMTRYVYDTKTFRLLRQRSEKYTYSQVSETHTYTPDSGTNRQDDGFNFDLVGNIMKILLRVDDCGITGVGLGANALDRTFAYDPLYRVISGNGRESDTQNQNDYLYSDAPAPGSPNADDVRAYARQYNYDKIGNVQQVTQSGTNGFTRNFVYNTGVNTLQQIETGSSVLIQDFTYDTVGNQITAGTTRNYVWNAGNQLITYYNQAGTADPTIFAQYDYSGMNRVSKMVRTGTAGSPIYERTIYIDGIFEYHILENGTTYEKNYVHVMDDQSRIAMVRIGTPFPDDITNAVTYNLEDQIGSSSVRLNTTGGVIDKEEYYPFGDSSLRTFAKKQYRYVGKQKDAESGLYYYGARYYSPWTCRFISVDPLAADYPFYTPYNYAGNKPINKIDIDGMQEGEPPAQTNNTEGNGDVSNSTGLNNPNINSDSWNIDPIIDPKDFIYFKSDAAIDPETGKWNCKVAGTKQTVNAGGSPGGSDTRLDVYNKNDEMQSIENVQLGIDIINRSLERGIPILVGISTGVDHKNTNRSTGHFVVFHGRGTDENGNKYYIAMDNATIKGDNPENPQNWYYILDWESKGPSNGAPINKPFLGKFTDFEATLNMPDGSTQTYHIYDISLDSGAVTEIRPNLKFQNNRQP